jgi:hypothetical protein
MTKNSLFSLSCQMCHAYFGADSPKPPPRPAPPRVSEFHQRSTSSSSHLNNADQAPVDAMILLDRMHSESLSSQTSRSHMQHQISQNMPHSPSSDSTSSIVFVPSSPRPMSPTNIGPPQTLYSSPINYANPPTIPYVPSHRPSLTGNNLSVLNQLAAINPIAPNGAPNTSSSTNTDGLTSRQVPSSSSSFY